METVERMALSRWSLLDTCMCALCSVLVITVDWIAARMPIQWARLARLWTRANFCSSSMAKVVWCSAHSCPELEQEKWFLVMTGFLQAVRRRHQQPKNLLDTRSEVSAKLKLSQNCERDTLHWSDPLREWKLWREWLSHSGHCLTTCMCALCSGLVITVGWIAARMPIQWARLARLFVLPACQDLFNPLLILARNWKSQRDSW